MLGSETKTNCGRTHLWKDKLANVLVSVFSSELGKGGWGGKGNKLLIILVLHDSYQKLIDFSFVKDSFWS